MGKFWSVSPSPQKPLPKENEDYCFSEIILAEETANAVKLLEGPYANVVFYYGGVKIVPENGTHRLAFQYTLWDTASFKKEDLVKSADFTNHLGDILVAIITDENEQGELAYPSKENEEEL